MNQRHARSSSSRTAARRRSSATRTASSRERGGGGLVTALTGLVHHRDAVWVASAMSRRGRRGGRAARRQLVRRASVDDDDLPDAARRERPRRLRPLLQRGREPDAVVHPALPLGPLERARHPPRTRSRPTSTATARSTQDLARAVLEEIEGEEEAVVMLHDYHLYTAPQVHPRRRGRTCSSTTSSTSRGPSRTPGACCPRDMREDIYEGILSNDIVAFHTRALPAQLPALLPRAVRPRRRRGGGRRAVRGPRGVGARLPAADLRRDLPASRPAAGGARVRARDPAPPARAPDPARGPRRPVEERAARLHRVRPVPRAAPRVPASRSPSSRT